MSRTARGRVWRLTVGGSDRIAQHLCEAGFVVNGWAEAVRLRKVGQLYHRAGVRACVGWSRGMGCDGIG